MDRSLVEASEDLYATPLGTFRQVVLPLLAPSILAGFLLAFTFSFEDFIIAYFVAGPDTTLPIYVFSSIRRGVTPEINAVGTVVLLTSLRAAGRGAAHPAARAADGPRLILRDSAASRGPRSAGPKGLRRWPRAGWHRSRPSRPSAISCGGASR